MQPLHRSWTSWSQRRLLRKQAKLRALMGPLLAENLLAMEQQVLKQLAQVQQSLPPQEAWHREQRELLVEILNSLQPEPTQAISQLLGLPTRPL